MYIFPGDPPNSPPSRGSPQPAAAARLARIFRARLAGSLAEQAPGEQELYHITAYYAMLLLYHALITLTQTSPCVRLAIIN